MKPVKNPAAAEAHNTRTWSIEHPPPAYLLDPDQAGPAWREIAISDVIDVFTQKMELATGKARAMARAGKYSPIWEGVLNLPPEGDHGQMVRAFCEGYQRLTGHRVLAADIHLDEGRVEDGRAVINAHAHVTVDRTDQAGRPIRLTRDRLRAVQDLAAEATGLQRGQDARETKRRHLPHQTYRAMARQGLIRQRERSSPLRKRRAPVVAPPVAPPARPADEALATAELYGLLRAAMKVSGRATQAHYQEARVHRQDRAWVGQALKLWAPALDHAEQLVAADRQRRLQEAPDAARRLADPRPEGLQAPAKRRDRERGPSY